MSSITVTVLLVIVAAASLLATDLEVQAQSNGDIRLVSNGRIDRGRLEVYINGEWGTICGKRGTNFKAVAETACRQLGLEVPLVAFYGTVTQLGFPVAPNSTPIHFGSINCGSRSSTSNLLVVCSTNYYEHVLRCAVDTKVDTTACTHDNDIGVSCSATRIIVNPYKSQIFLYAADHGGQQRSPNISLSSLSSGVLGIFLGKGGPVCGEGFDKSAADTACRQLGYTNSNLFKTSPETMNRTFWDAGLNCKSQSHS
jgi:hypothetical protein